MNYKFIDSQLFPDNFNAIQIFCQDFIKSGELFGKFVKSLVKIAP